MPSTTRILDANVNGTVYTSNANDALEAIDTSHSGPTAPTDEVANGKLWLDTSTTPGVLKVYNNAAWTLVQSGPDVNVTGAFTSKGIDDNATSTALVIDVSGNVGIGTATPAEKLVVSDTTGATVRINSTKDGTWVADEPYGVLEFYGNDTSGTGPDVRASIEGVSSNTFGIAGSLLFKTNNGAGPAIENMRLAANGYLGVGTAAPSARLHVSNGSAGFEFFPDGIADGTSYMQAFDRTAGTYDKVRWYALEHQFYNGATEGMRITSDGYILVGCTTTPDGSTAGAGFVSETNGREVLRCSGSTTAQVSVQRFYNPNGQVGEIKTQNSSTLYVTSSDYRLKENVTTIQGAADIVKSMRPVTYTFKADGEWADGFLADELQELHPAAVTGVKDGMKDEEYEITPAVEATYDAEGVELTPAEDAVMGTRSVPDYQGVDYAKLTPILTAALQEALNKIDALTARIEVLEAQ
jgi:hypothetical protein